MKNQRYFRGAVIFGVEAALLLESYGRLVNNLYVHVAFFVVFLPRLCHSVIQFIFLGLFLRCCRAIVVMLWYCCRCYRSIVALWLVFSLIILAQPNVSFSFPDARVS